MMSDQQKKTKFPCGETVMSRKVLIFWWYFHDFGEVERSSPSLNRNTDKIWCNSDK